MTGPAAGTLREIVGEDVEVPVVTGGTRRYVNLDVAASAPALRAVADGVAACLPWYASVHRGAGFKSRVSTELYERAREAIRTFVGARSDDAVVITRNTTDAINLLASALPERTTVLVFAVEHHANMLPWRHGTHHGRVRYLPVPSSPDDLVGLLDAALREERAGGTAPFIGARRRRAHPRLHDRGVQRHRRDLAARAHLGDRARPRGALHGGRRAAPTPPARGHRHATGRLPRDVRAQALRAVRRRRARRAARLARRDGAVPLGRWGRPFSSPSTT